MVHIFGEQFVGCGGTASFSFSFPGWSLGTRIMKANVI
jgi:hypothetical protein